MGRGVGDYTRDFVRNWKASDAPFGAKLRIALRNRARTLVNRGCCGHRGEPGC